MRQRLHASRRDLASSIVIVLALLSGPRALSAQVAGYTVGTRGLDVRAIPCSPNESGLLCEPSGAVYLRIHDSTLVQIDSTWYPESPDFISSPDIWRQLQGTLIARFGSPDSVRTMNPLKLPRAYSDGVAVFWRKQGWCAVLTVMTGVVQSHPFIKNELSIVQRGPYGFDCSVYPYLEPSR